MNSIIVSKLGGSITATPDAINHAASLIMSDPSRKYIIATAPANPGETGITDMLFMCHASRSNPAKCSEILAGIKECYRQIIDRLGVSFDIDSEISSIRDELAHGRGLDYIGSRGEYIMGKILASFLGWPFVDASGIIFFNNDGTLNEADTFTAAGGILKAMKHAVIPGFYGSMPDGSIKTFPRGDADSSGAVIARAVKADLFEKWSETAKVFGADIAVVPEAVQVRNITYSEAVELNYVGVDIIRDNVIFMMRDANIPIRICGFNDDDDEGLLITGTLPAGISRGISACITGRRKYSVLHIEKYGLNKIAGFGEKLFATFARHGVSCEHCMSGIYKMSVVIKSPLFDIRRGEVLDDVRRVIEPDSITVERDLSLIAVIGEGIGTAKGMFEAVFSALSQAGVKVRMIDQGSDSMNIILGVNDRDYARAVKALYYAMIDGKHSAI